MTFQDYLNSLDIKDNLFYGHFQLGNNPNTGYLKNIMSKNGKLLLHPISGRRQSIYLHLSSHPELINNQFYSFRLRFSYEGNQEKAKNPYSCAILRGNPTFKILSENPFQKIIQKRYNRLNNPDSNRIIANLLREIGKGMYSSKKRMIFELLQNADDVPAADDVKFYIETHGDYMIIGHDGLPFNQEDINSITSAAESTKQKKKKKTGYKGIGFKSVFTDSTEVIIKSAGFQFAFDKKHTAFESFDKFYFDPTRDEYQKVPGLLAYKKDLYQEYKRDYKGKNDLPWQILPVWKDKLPHSLNQSNFSKYDNNVSIALKFGSQKVKEYLDEIVLLAKDGRFMLFLRNTSFFRCAAKNVSVVKEKNSDTGETRILVNYQNRSEKYIYKVEAFDDVEVSDHSFDEFGIELKKDVEKLETGQEIPFFIDLAGNKIESIPSKIAAFDNTTISFAAPIKDGLIQKEPSFGRNVNFSYFFTYLPMKENRIKFPFLVNADFVPSSNREEIQGDNPWNAYLFANIGYRLLKWVARLANESNPKYLTLLLPKLMDAGDSDIQLLTSKFNEYYQKGLDEVPFILNEENVVVKKEEIILDETGIAKILGSQFFYELLGTSKKLPNPAIESEILYKKIFSIEQNSYDSLITIFETGKGEELLEKTIANLDEKGYRDFLKWYDNFLNHKDTGTRLKESVNLLSFIRIKENGNTLHYGWKYMKDNNDVLLLDLKTSKIKAALKEINLIPTELNISYFTRIKSLLNIEDSYLKKDSILAAKVASKLIDNSLPTSEKVNLMRFFERLDIDDEVVRRIHLFKSTNGNTLPINRLISNKASYYSDWLANYKIDKSEEEIIGNYARFLCQSNEIYVSFLTDDTILSSLLENVNNQNRVGFYDFVFNAYSDSYDKSTTLVTLPIIFVNKEFGYKKLHDLYFTQELLEKKDFYESIKSAIETISSLQLPDVSVLPFLLKYKPQGDKKLIVNHLHNQSTILTTEQARSLLIFMVSLSHRDNLLENGYFKMESENLAFILDKSIKNYSIQQEEVQTLLTQLLVPNTSNLQPLPYILKDIPGLSILGLVQKDGITKIIRDSLPPNLINAPYIYYHLTKENWKVWLKRLDRLALSSTKKYTNEDNEFSVLSMLSELLNTDSSLVNDFRKIIIIDDDQTLNSIAVQEEVTVDYNGNKYFFSLSRLLPSFAGKSNLVNSVVQNLEGIGQLDKLFDIKPKSDISADIIKEYPTLENEEQYIYLQTLYLINGKSGYLESSTALIKPEKVLTFCYEQSNKYQEHYPPLENFINNLNKWHPVNHLYPSELAYDSEKIPDWINDWLVETVGINQRKIDFLETLGLNTADSAVGRLRKFFLTGDGEELDAQIKYLSENPNGWLTRTIDWISSENITIDWNTKKRSVYLKILKDCTFNEEITLPFITKIENKNPAYSFEKVYKLGKPIYDEKDLLEISEQYQKNIEQLILANGILLPKELSNSWKPKSRLQAIVIQEEKDMEILESIPLFSDLKYDSWTYKPKYSLKELKENIPILIKFNDNILDRKSGNSYEKIDEVIYFNSNEVTWHEVIKDFANVEELISLFASSFEEIGKKDKEIEVLNQEKSALEKELETIKAKLKAKGINIDEEPEKGNQPETDTDKNTTSSPPSGSIGGGFVFPISTTGGFTGSVIDEEDFGVVEGGGYRHVDKETQIRINEETRELVKRYLLEHNYSIPTPFGPYSRIDGVKTPNGVEIPLVVKSAKSGKLAIHPNEWMQLMKPNARLYLRTSDRKINSVSFEDLLSTNNKFQIEFDVAHFSYEMMFAFAQIFKFTRDVKFLVHCSAISYNSMEKNFRSKDGEAGTMELGI